MRWIPLLLVSHALMAQEAPAPEKKPPLQLPSAAVSVNAKTIMEIDSKSRASDYLQAFELLRKEKPTLKIMIRTASGLTLMNVTEISVAQNNTLFFIRYISSQGNKIQILPIEDLTEINYSP